MRALTVAADGVREGIAVTLDPCCHVRLGETGAVVAAPDVAPMPLSADPHDQDLGFLRCDLLRKRSGHVVVVRERRDQHSEERALLLIDGYTGVKWEDSCGFVCVASGKSDLCGTHLVIVEKGACIRALYRNQEDVIQWDGSSVRVFREPLWELYCESRTPDGDLL